MTHYKPQNTEGRYMEDIAKALVAWYSLRTSIIRWMAVSMRSWCRTAPLKSSPTILTMRGAGTTLINHGLCDENMQPSMPLVKGETYLFSVWAKAKRETSIKVVLENADGQEISELVSVAIEGTGEWKKYEGGDTYTLSFWIYATRFANYMPTIPGCGCRSARSGKLEEGALPGACNVQRKADLWTGTQFLYEGRTGERYHGISCENGDRDRGESVVQSEPACYTYES